MSLKEATDHHQKRHLFPSHVVLTSNNHFMDVVGINFGKETTVEYKGPHFTMQGCTAGKVIHRENSNDLSSSFVSRFEKNNAKEFVTENIGKVIIKDCNQLEEVTIKNASMIRAEGNPLLRNMDINLGPVKEATIKNNPNLVNSDDTAFIVATQPSHPVEHIVTDGDLYVFGKLKGAKHDIVNHFDKLAEKARKQKSELEAKTELSQLELTKELEAKKIQLDKEYA